MNLLDGRVARGHIRLYPESRSQLVGKRLHKTMFYSHNLVWARESVTFPSALDPYRADIAIAWAYGALLR